MRLKCVTVALLLTAVVVASFPSPSGSDYVQDLGTRGLSKVPDELTRAGRTAEADDAAPLNYLDSSATITSQQTSLVETSSYSAVADALSVNEAFPRPDRVRSKRNKALTARDLLALETRDRQELALLKSRLRQRRYALRKREEQAKQRGSARAIAEVLADKALQAAEVAAVETALGRSTRLSIKKATSSKSNMDMAYKLSVAKGGTYQAKGVNTPQWVQRAGKRQAAEASSQTLQRVVRPATSSSASPSTTDTVRDTTKDSSHSHRAPVIGNASSTTKNKPPVSQDSPPSSPSIFAGLSDIEPL